MSKIKPWAICADNYTVICRTDRRGKHGAIYRTAPAGVESVYFGSVQELKSLIELLEDADNHFTGGQNETDKP